MNTPSGNESICSNVGARLVRARAWSILRQGYGRQASHAPTGEPKTADYTPSGLLVIGYGNTLRQDDSAGPRVAEQVAALDLPGVDTLVCPQLSPEHAEVVAQAAAVVFVDASADARQGGRLRLVLPDESPQLMTHAADPGKMLALARDVYGHAPRAWVLPVPAQNFGFGEEVSAVTRLGIAAAVRAVGRLALREQGITRIMAGVGSASTG